MAAAYSVPGAYERVLYYYSYKLDQMTGGQNIGSGCAKNRVCSFDEFIHYIEGNKPGKIVAITPDEFPDIEKTAKKLQELGKTGTVNLGRVIDKAESYPDLLKKLGSKLEGPMSKNSGFKHGSLVGEDLVTKIDELRKTILQSMQDVFDTRLRATFDSFKPYGKFVVVEANGGKAVDFIATVEKNKGSITVEKLQELWAKHVKGQVVTEAIVKQFKPLADYSPQVQEIEAKSLVMKDKMLKRADADLTLREAVKKDSWMSKKWLQGRYVETIAGNHQENLRELNGAIKTIRRFCDDTAKRDAGIMGKRKLSGCGLWDLADLGPWLDAEAPGAVARKAKMATLANQVSKHEFEVAVAKTKARIPGSWRKNSVAALDQVRKNLLKHELFAPHSLKLPASKSFGHAAKGLGRLGWAVSVAYSFTTDTTELDKLAAVTSIIPFVGCATNAASLVEKDHDTTYVALDTILCAAADALLLSGGLAPVGVLIHLARLVMSFFVAPPGPTLDELKQRSSNAWSEFLEVVYANVYSSSWHGDTSFGSKLESALTINHFAALSDAADQVGLLNASSWATIDTFGSQADFNQDQVEVESEEAIAAIRARTPTMVARRQRDYLFDILTGFSNGTAFSLKDTATKFTAELEKMVNSDEFWDKYPAGKFIFNVQRWDSDDPADTLKAQKMVHNLLRTRIKNGFRMTFPPPSVPPAFNFAFVLGQSKGLRTIHPETLSAFSFFDAEISEASPEPIPTAYRDSLVIHHTMAVVQRIRGQSRQNHVNEQIFPLEDPTLLHRLHHLIAMKLGYIHETSRFWEGNNPSFQSPPLYFVEPIAAYPFVPPVDILPRASLLISFILGIADTVDDAWLESKVQESLLKDSSDLKEKNKWKALQLAFKHIHAIAENLAKKETSSPRPPQEFVQAFSGVCGQQTPENCAPVVDGCYYRYNTTKEFVETCMHETFENMAGRTLYFESNIRHKMNALYEEFDSHSNFTSARYGCMEVYPTSTMHVIYECSRRWLLRLRQHNPVPVATTTSPSTTEGAEGQ